MIKVDKPELVKRALTEARLACLPRVPDPEAPSVSRYEPCRHLAIFMLCALRLIGEADYVSLATTLQLFGSSGGHGGDPLVGSYDFPLVHSTLIRPGVVAFLCALEMTRAAGRAQVEAALSDIGVSDEDAARGRRAVSRMIAGDVMDS